MSQFQAAAFTRLRSGSLREMRQPEHEIGVGREREEILELVEIELEVSVGEQQPRHRRGADPARGAAP
jgi:hypothetical protein